MTTPPVPNPRVPGLEPTIVTPGSERDMPWQAVRQIRRADGTVASVYERWVAFSEHPPYLALFARWDPGMIVRRHGHLSPHVLTVLSGSMRCGDVECPAGTHIELPLGASFGPFVAGPDGVELYEVMMGDPRSWSDEPEAWDAVLGAEGAAAMPDPPITLPEWLEDLRGAWSQPGAAEAE